MSKYSEDTQAEQPAIDLFDQLGIIETSINKLLIHCYGEKGEEIASEINKRMHWEFDNNKGHEVEKALFRTVKIYC